MKYIRRGEEGVRASDRGPSENQAIVGGDWSKNTPTCVSIIKVNHVVINSPSGNLIFSVHLFYILWLVKHTLCPKLHGVLRYQQSPTTNNDSPSGNQLAF